MKCNAACQLVSVLLLSTFSGTGYAADGPRFAGPTYLNAPQSNSSRFRIYHGFDLAFMMAKSASDVNPTFNGADTTPISDSVRLKRIADMGYTHIQISPPHTITPTSHNTFGPTSTTVVVTTLTPAITAPSSTVNGTAELKSTINVNAKPSNLAKFGFLPSGDVANPTPTVTINNQLVNSGVKSTAVVIQNPTQVDHDYWYLSYQPYICVLDAAYQSELNAVFGTANGSPNKPISNYGITLGDGTVVGFRLGNDRYGSLADLVTLIQNARQYGLGIVHGDCTEN
ncbi:hypothetical protein [Candidatus Finniella inopinata]|uniref:Uncharacterized protein n=1 Tax=Candidatus Finniella inopinata TaxID=1696036 RepID=A0A4Q7DID0_9PROT|nr:hypothetical protein [Candidatus Finniella inopinata]RZI46731.1 hypothetical protein EQU50_01715 [Candidatus Finniella inopinata]